jgi:hypothetical protein
MKHFEKIVSLLELLSAIQKELTIMAFMLIFFGSDLMAAVSVFLE